MKIVDVLKENNYKHPAWQEGNDAFYKGKQPDHCPYEDNEERVHWLAGWREASLSDE